MEIVGIHYVSDPSEVFGTGALRTIWTSPFQLTIQTCEARAVVVELAVTVVGAVVPTIPVFQLSSVT